MNRSIMQEDSKQEDEVSKFASAVRQLQPAYKTGLGAPMFIENQIATITQKIMQKKSGTNTAPSIPNSPRKTNKDIQ